MKLNIIAFFRFISCLLLIFIILSCSPAYYILDLGHHIEEIPDPIKKSGNLAFLFIGMILETWETRLGEIPFQFAFDSKGEIIYIQNESTSFRTSENLGLESSMEECLNHSEQGIRVIPGIAYYIPLKSGWNVEIGDIFQDIHKIKNKKASPRFFFKRHNKLSKSIAFEDYIAYTEQADILPLLGIKGNRKVFLQEESKESSIR